MLLWFSWPHWCSGWRFQFSIRSLLVLTVAVALPCSWLAAEMKKARQQASDRDELWREGVTIMFDNYMGPHPGPPAAMWLLRHFGYSFFSEIASISPTIFHETRITDTTLEKLEGLTALQSFDLMRRRSRMPG